MARGDLEARVARGDGLIEALALVQQEREVDPACGVGRREARRLDQQLLGLGELPLLGQKQAEIGHGACIAPIDGEHLSIEDRGVPWAARALRAQGRIEQLRWLAQHAADYGFLDESPRRTAVYGFSHMTSAPSFAAF